MWSPFSGLDQIESVCLFSTSVLSTQRALNLQSDVSQLWILKIFHWYFYSVLFCSLTGTCYLKSWSSKLTFYLFLLSSIFSCTLWDVLYFYRNFSSYSLIFRVVCLCPDWSKFFFSICFGLILKAFLIYLKVGFKSW